MKTINRVKQLFWYRNQGVSQTELIIIVAITVMLGVSGWQYFSGY